MKTAGIIGRRIVRISQYRTGRASNVPEVFGFHEIEMDNGVIFRPLVIEGESDYHVALIRVKAKGKPQ